MGSPDDTGWEAQPSDYQVFLDEVQDLLRRISEHGDLLSPVRREELAEALSELSDHFTRAKAELDLPTARADLEARGLDRAGGRLKLKGWRRARQRFFDWMSRKNVKRALRWASPILDSLSAFVPPVKAVQELVLGAENLVSDAEDAGAP
jgi:hypothetical protein